MRRRSLSAPTTRGNSTFRNSRFGGQQRRPKRNGQYIDPQKFVNAGAQSQGQAEFVPDHRFVDFGLLAPLQQNVDAHGYITPTPIQDGAIKPIIAGRDLLGIANTGTGKTAAFLLPIIQRLKTDLQGRTVLIIAPTRELAQQINEEFNLFARGLGLRSALCLGGASIHAQVQALRRRPQFVIGTPGRLKDLNQKGALRLDRVGVLVLDEADHMFDMGFLRDITYLIGQLPVKRQTLCFSATIPNEIRHLIDENLVDPVTISVRTSETSDHVEQDVIRVQSKDEKVAKLIELLGQDGFEKVLVFGQTKWGVQRLADTLVKQGVQAEAIHGNKSQPQRQRALRAFKDGKVSVLVATDVAARGLDIESVSHVINFDQPNTYDDYIHRIGRTGRAGNRGKALTFVAG